MNTQLVINGSIVTIPVVAEATQYPQVRGSYKPKTHSNDRVRVALGKRTCNKEFTGSVNTFAALKGLIGCLN